MKKRLAKDLKKGDIVEDEDGLWIVTDDAEPYDDPNRCTVFYIDVIEKIRCFNPKKDDEFMILSNDK